MSAKETPQSLGFRMPAEWEPQESVWISWPHNEITWGDLILDVERTYAEFAHLMSDGQKVNILVADSEMERRAKETIRKIHPTLHNVHFHHIRTVDTWIRDYGPTFVVNSTSKAMVKWQFNSWGNKYDDLLADNSIPYAMNERLGLAIFEPHIVMEGGSIEVNGTGTVLTTTQCLLNKNRNPNLSKEQIEGYLKDYLSVRNVLWLGDGIAGDDTDGHIDDLSRFVNKNTVVTAFEDDVNDENYAMLKENYDLLCTMQDEDGTPLTVVKLPMPGNVSDSEGRLPASYTNFYIGNKAVAVPVFGHANDEVALSILAQLFPTRKVVGINCHAMVHGFGTLHCCSQQEPKAL